MPGKLRLSVTRGFAVTACARGYFRVTVTGARHLIDRKFHSCKMTNIATPQPLNYKIRKRLSGLAMEALARLVQSSLCAHIVLPFSTGIWPQLVLTAGTSVQQDTLLVSIKVIFLCFTGFLELSVNSESLAEKRKTLHSAVPKRNQNSSLSDRWFSQLQTQGPGDSD